MFDDLLLSLRDDGDDEDGDETTEDGSSLDEEDEGLYGDEEYDPLAEEETISE